MPKTVLIRLLTECPWPSSATRGLVQAWRRFPGPMLDAVRHSFDAGRAEPAWGLVEAAPAEQTEKLVNWLRQRIAVLDLDEPALHRVRGWLGRSIRRRDPGWRRSYDYLDEIEQGLLPMRSGR
jgi:hypothetical protein